MKKILLTRNIPINKDNYPDFDIVVLELGRAPTKDELKDHAHDCWGLVTTLEDKIDEDLLKSFPQLNIITQFAVGTNNIDLKYCREHNIAVCNTPDVLTEATAELTFALMIHLARKLSPAMDNAKTGQWKGWEPMGFLGKALKGKNLGIIGAGRIGERVAEMAHRGFGMNILYHNRKPNKKIELQLQARMLDKRELLSDSDVLVLMTPLTPETRGMIGSAELKLMKNDAILINTSRGEILDQAALVEELKNGKFFGVGLDVTTPEPLPSHHELYQFDRVVITPHIGSATEEARRAMAQLCFDNLKNKASNIALLTPV
ncbi:MAG: D-glycerate dehydrogenase [Bdellovibrio sp.]